MKAVNNRKKVKKSYIGLSTILFSGILFFLGEFLEMWTLRLAGFILIVTMSGATYDLLREIKK